MAVTTTGQFTIVDQNDGKPIMAFVSADGALQQSYSKDNGIVKYNPDRTVSNLTLTAKVYVGGTDYTNSSALSSKSWSTSYNGTSLGSNSTYVVNTNISSPDTTPSTTYYYKATYTDPVTQLQSRVDAQVTISAVVVGSNATYVVVQGTDVIEKSPTTAKNVAYVKAELMRSSGIDVDALQYRWYSVSTAGVATQLTGTQTNYGSKSTAPGSAPTGAIGEVNNSSYAFPANAGDWSAVGTATSLTTTAVSGSGTAVTVTYSTQGSAPFTVNSYVVLSGVTPSAYNGTWKVTACTTTAVTLESTATGTVTAQGTVKGQTVGNNTLVISEDAVSNYGLYKVEVKDSAETGGPVYTQYFTIYDVSDNYTTEIFSQGGDRLLNGQGSTTLRPVVKYGSNEISDYNGWTLNWYIRDKNNVRCGFVKDASPVSRNISSTTNPTTITLGASATTTEFPANSLVKLVSSDGLTITYAEVASVSGTTLTIKSSGAQSTFPNDHTNLGANFSTSVSTASTAGTGFAGGTVYAAVAARQVVVSTTTSTAPTITVTQYDIDSKNIITVQCSKA